MPLFTNYLWPIINYWSVLGISHYNYFPTASCLDATESVLSSFSTTPTYTFALQSDNIFCWDFNSAVLKNIPTKNCTLPF